MAAADDTTAKDLRKTGVPFLEEVRAQREARIVQVATSVLHRRGCGGFRMEDVARVSGVAKGTCYQHFGSQEDLIATAVRGLDAALTARLSTPPSRLTKRRQILEWAVLQGVNAQIVAITQRIRQGELSPEALSGTAWPCCHSQTPCPYGGAERFSNALLRWTTRSAGPTRVSRAVSLALLLAIVPTYCLVVDRHGKLPSPRLIRAMARQYFDRLFPPRKPSH